MEVRIDRRPLWVILLVKGLRPLAFLGIALVCWYILSSEPPDGLTTAGWNSIAIFIVCLFLWITNLIPLAVTGILAIIMVPLFGVLTERETFALFGNEAVFFILGAFILSGAVMHSGLSRRVALFIMGRAGNSPKGLVRAIFILAALLSCIMSEHAVAAMLFPMVLEIAQGLKLRPGKSNYGKLLFISLAWGCIIGGVATFLGGARVPLAVGILKETVGESIGFFEYSRAVFPVVVVMLFVAYNVLVRIFPIDIAETGYASGLLIKRLHDLGRMRYREYAVGVVMALTVLAWLFLGSTVGLATISLASVVLLFILKLVRWKDIEEYVNWGIILMYGGAIILGKALGESGAATWMADRTIGAWATSPWAVIALLSLTTLVLTEGISNAAVIAILMPVGIGMADRFGLSPVTVTFAIAVPAGLAFALPMSTPANAIAVSSSYVTVRDMMKAGIFMGVTAWIVFNLVARFYWPLIGMGL
ncbi:MAG: SLC13 family permease [Thermodesulfobacteriota bacterium]